MLYPIVDWSLSIVVNKVWVTSKTDKFLACLNMSFSDTVEYGGLSIGVHMIHIHTLRHQILNDFVVTISWGVVKRSLV